jgi:hypothetical protein
MKTSVCLMQMDDLARSLLVRFMLQRASLQRNKYGGASSFYIRTPGVEKTRIVGARFEQGESHFLGAISIMDFRIEPA